jgi:hypothetical protein
MFDTPTFLTVWYWLFSAFFWSLVSNWTLGVSKWMMDRIDDPEEREMALRVARRGIRSVVRDADNPSVKNWAFNAFVLAVLATLAVVREVEMAQGALFLLVPVALLGFWRRRVARRLMAEAPGDDALLAEIRRMRRVKQGVAMLSIVAAAGYGMWLHRGDIVWQFSG